MSYYDNNYSSLNEVWGRVPNYSQYSDYQSDKNEYGQTFTSFDRNGPQLNRDFRRKYDIARDYNPEADSVGPSRQYTYIKTANGMEPRPPIRSTIPESTASVVSKCDEYKTKVSYGPGSYPNTYPMEYFTQTQCDDRRMIKFYNRAILVLLLGLLIKWMLDRYNE